MSKATVGLVASLLLVSGLGAALAEEGGGTPSGPRQAGLGRTMSRREFFGGGESRVNVDPRWAERMQRLGSELESFDNASRPFDFLNTAVQVGSAFWDEFQNLTPEDQGYHPDYSPDGQPQLPVGCDLNTDSAADCRDCYTRAQGRLEVVRSSLEALRAIHASTKLYTDRSIAFGDTVSGVHGVSGLSWQYEKRGIIAQFQRFEQKYDSKYAELMRTLRASLDDISTCEARYFDNPDWFSRYGFMYYQFMEARYRR
jgi:hypothetical protein